MRPLKFRQWISRNRQKVSQATERRVWADITPYFTRLCSDTCFELCEFAQVGKHHKVCDWVAEVVKEIDRRRAAGGTP